MDTGYDCVRQHALSSFQLECELGKQKCIILKKKTAKEKECP